MATYILRRIGLALVTLWLLSVIVFFAGQVLPGDAVETQLATMPGKNELRATLLATLQAPLQKFVALLAAPAQNFVYVLSAKEREGAK